MWPMVLLFFNVATFLSLNYYFKRFAYFCYVYSKIYVYYLKLKIVFDSIHLDTLPKQNETKDAKVCQVNFEGQCSRQHNIKIRNCGTFFVYELKSLNSCPSAYCFGK